MDRDEQGNLKTLFHGLNGSRTIPLGKWLTATMKPVKDGSSKTTYLSGWHIVPSKEECLEYLKYFKNIENKVVVKCRAKTIRPKKHSRHNVFLSKYIIIDEVLYEYNKMSL
jgi:hypothetical protein